MSSIYGNTIEIATLVVKLSSRCNMNCDYCYIYNSKDNSWKNMPVIMPHDLIAILSDRISEIYNKQQTKPLIVFHGGEPLLVGVSYLKKLINKILNSTPTSLLSIQSNGTIYNKELESFLKEYKGKISFSISVDGFKEEHDRHRKGLKGQSVYNKIKKTILQSSSSKLLENILMVVDIANDPHKIFQFMKSCDINSFNIILPDGDYNSPPINKENFSSIKFGQWMWDLFKEYATTENKFRIKFFDDIAKGLLKQKEQIKSPLSTYSICTMTVDTNGDIKQSDTFRINGNGADNIGKFNIKTHSLRDIANSEENINYMKKIECLAKDCLECRYLNVCGGGYPSHRLNGLSFNNPSIYCKDYIYLFNKMEAVL